MTEINNRIEEVKEIADFIEKMPFSQKPTRNWCEFTARQIFQLFPQPLDDKGLREKIIDSLHWTEYTFIGQGEAIFEGSLTQKSEERIADQILALLQPKIEEVKREERERVTEWLEFNAPEFVWQRFQDNIDIRKGKP